jgi:hypothetical protein
LQAEPEVKCDVEIDPFSRNYEPAEDIVIATQLMQSPDVLRPEDTSGDVLERDQDFERAPEGDFDEVLTGSISKPTLEAEAPPGGVPPNFSDVKVATDVFHREESQQSRDSLSDFETGQADKVFDPNETVEESSSFEEEIGARKPSFDGGLGATVVMRRDPKECLSSASLSKFETKIRDRFDKTALRQKIFRMINFCTQIWSNFPPKNRRSQSYDHELQRQRCKNYNATNSITRFWNKNCFSPM